MHARTPTAIAVVVDVLRATSSIVVALDAGAPSILPVRDPDEAIALMRRLGRDRTLLAGEREMRRIEGFDLDNSPESFTREAIAGRSIVFTTTNGTRALLDASRGTTTVYCGALTNRSAVVDALAATPDDAVTIVCAANNGEASFEDSLCAGAIIDGMIAREPDVAITDAARIALALYAANRKRLTAAVASGSHAKRLVQAGFTRDIGTCSQLDLTDCLPVYADGAISRAAQREG